MVGRAQIRYVSLLFVTFTELPDRNFLNRKVLFQFVIGGYRIRKPHCLAIDAGCSLEVWKHNYVVKQGEH